MRRFRRSDHDLPRFVPGAFSRESPDQCQHERIELLLPDFSSSYLLEILCDDRSAREPASGFLHLLFQKAADLAGQLA